MLWRIEKKKSYLRRLLRIYRMSHVRSQTLEQSVVLGVRAHATKIGLQLSCRGLNERRKDCVGVSALSRRGMNARF